MSKRKKESGPELGRRLAKARADAGLSMRALATVAGVSPQTVNSIERGEGGGSSINTIADLARALAVDPRWLAYGDKS